MTHPQKNQLEVIDELVGEGTITSTNRNSLLSPQEEQKPPPREGSMVMVDYAEEESSLAVINLKKEGPSPDKLDAAARKEASLLPKIDQDRAKKLFMDTTPDSQGIQKRRFMEIIDSDDETNGNGSCVQRVTKKKFRTQRDAFGDDSGLALNKFPTAEESEVSAALKVDAANIIQEEDEDRENTNKAADDANSRQIEGDTPAANPN